MQLETVCYIAMVIGVVIMGHGGITVIGAIRNSLLYSIGDR